MVDQFNYASLAVTDSRSLVVRRFLLNGMEYIDIRWWYRYKGMDEARPSRKGICIEREIFDNHFFELVRLSKEQEIIPVLDQKKLRRNVKCEVSVAEVE